MKGGQLGDYVDFLYGRSLPARSRRTGTVPVFGSAGRVGSHDEALVKGPGVIVGRKGTVGAVHWSDDDFYPIDTTYYVVPKNECELRRRYVYYLLNTLSLRNMNTDSAVPGLNRSNALRQRVTIASVSNQDVIIDVLSAYDHLIENNRRRIALLDRAARLVYREWFINFRFPAHKRARIINGIPKGWRRTRVGEIASFQYGRSLKRESRIPGDYPVYGSSGVVGTHREPLVIGPSIIVGRKGNVGSVFWSQQDFYPIDTVYYVNSDDSSLFLYHALRHTTFINTDVAVPGLNRTYAHSRPILLPTKELFDRFEQYAAPMYRQVSCLTKCNAALAKARDLLLPRLMSGRIPV